MDTTGFHDDLRFCPACRRHLPYLLSPRAAHCAQCGEVVRLFSDADMETFRSSTPGRVSAVEELEPPALRGEWLVFG